MNDFLKRLAAVSRADTVVVNAQIDDALARLDHMLEGLCAELEVEFNGPYVGVETPGAHQLVVRAHEWRMGVRTWSLKVCVTAPAAQYRPEWAIQGTGRLRKQIIVKALPEFFAGFARAVDQAGKSTSPAGRRIHALGQLFGNTPMPN